MTTNSARLNQDQAQASSKMQDDKLAYAFTVEESIDADERYVRDPILPSSHSYENDPNKSIFAILSSELSNKVYEVRTAAQQSEWAEKKSICQKRLLTEMLKFKGTWSKLIDACDEKTEHLLGILKQTDEGCCIEYDIRLHLVVKSLAYDYLNGTCEYSLEELSTLLVEEYNLSYCHFTKKAAKEFFDEFKLVDDARKEHVQNSTFGSNLQPDLFDIPDAVVAFENNEGVSWSIARTTHLMCQSLDARITQLRNLLVVTNMKACLKHAINYYFSGSGNKQNSLDQLDLFSEGVEGLIHAADMFVYGISAKFSTYADYWVKLKISRFIKNSFTVKIPIHVSDQIGKITRYIREWKKDNEASRLLPSMREVSKAIGENISDSVWQLAMLRQNSTPFSVACVNSESEEGFLSFDMFSEISIEGEESSLSAETQQILHVAKDLMNGISRRRHLIEREEWDKKNLGPFQPKVKGPSKPLLTHEQFQIFCLKFVYEKSHAEIAEIVGPHLTSKTIRREADRVMKLIRHELNIKVEEGKDNEL